MKNIEPLPDTFVSAEEAGEFWDSHSTSDYEEYLESADMTIDIKERHYEIEIDKETFFALSISAKKAHKSIKNLASSILNKELAPV